MSNLFIYKSSAGSGKTYKLAKEYLKLAFRYPGAFKNILAITFTNKATDEMKKRVIDFLADLANERNSDLKKQLEEEGVKGNIKELAQTTLNSILHNYSDFSISTIDSFFNRVLRSFSKELKLRVGFEIELDNKKVLNEIVDLMMKGIKEDGNLEKYLTDFVLSKINEDKGWDIEKDIKKLGNEIFRERYLEKKFDLSGNGTIKGLGDSREKIKTLIDEINIIRKDFENNLKSIGDKAERILKDNGLEIEDFSYGESGVMGFLTKKLKYDKNYEITKRVLSVYESGKGWFKEKSKKKTEIVQAVEAGLERLLNEAIEFIQSESKKYNTALLLAGTIYSLGIFEDLNIRLNEYRKINGKLLQSDVNGILLGLISEDNSPFIYEKIGSNYRNILVDEFQDTSTFQWKNLLPLIINSLSEQNSAYIVGDVKQSIYRWRNGNMNLLLSQIYQDMSSFEEMVKSEYLKKNRRSRKEIVEFNNSFFGYASEKITDGVSEKFRKMIEDAYSKENIRQEYVKEGGYVQVKFFSAEPEQELTVKDAAENYTEEILKDIIKDGYKLSDVLILVRTNDEARRISGYLAGKGISIISSESLMVNNSPKVRLVVDLMKYITDYKDDIAKADAVYNYMNIFEEGAENIFEKTSEMFLEKIPDGFFKENEKPKVNTFLYSSCVYEIFENLSLILGFALKKDSYLMKFGDLILEYSKENNNDLKSFLDWWEEKKNEFTVNSSPGTDAVNIMTIHKAKGLQGKIVILPYSNQDINIDGRKELIWVSSDDAPYDKFSAYLVKAVLGLKETFFEQEYNYEFAQTRLDNLNLLYVAFTRAEDRLYVIVPEKNQKGNTGYLIKSIIEEFYKPADDLFETGKKSLKEKEKNKQEIETETLTEYNTVDWNKKIVIKSEFRKVKDFGGTGFEYGIDRGIVLHELLSGIRKLDESESFIERMINEGKISPDDKSKITSDMERIKSNPFIKDWFENGAAVKTEKEVILKDGSILRPDRVIIKEDEAIVIEYKTGLEREEHKTQVKKYASVLSEMGYKRVKGFIAYIGSGETGIKITEVQR
jgi:ATP-dependent exoDNAse (exonuclease V) beta subunit